MIVPFGWDPWLAVALVLGVLLAGFVKGSVGFGLGLVITPAIALAVDPTTAVVFFCIPSLVTNLWVIAQERRRATPLAAIRPVLVTTAIGTILGAAVLTMLPARLLAGILGALTLGYVALAVSGREPRIPAGAERSSQPFVGLLGGALTGATNISGPLFGMYLSSLGMPKGSFALGLAVIFTVTNSVQVASYASFGLFTPERLALSAMAIPLVFIGLWAGIAVRDRVAQGAFNRLVQLVLAVSGASLLWGAVAK